MRTHAQSAFCEFWTRVGRIVRPNPLLVILSLGIPAFVLWLFVFGQQGLWPDESWYHICETLWVVCIPVLFSVLVDRSILEESLRKIIHAEVRLGVASEVTLAKTGIRQAHERLDFKRIFNEARPGAKIFWLDTYCPRKDDFIDELKEALARDVTVDMLMIRQNSRNSQYRSQEIVDDLDYGDAWATGLEDFARRMLQLQQQMTNLHIRQYDDLPCVPMYLIKQADGEHTGYSSWFLSRASAHFVHLEFGAGPLFSAMDRYFSLKWKRWPPT